MVVLNHRNRGRTRGRGLEREIVKDSGLKCGVVDETVEGVIEELEQVEVVVEAMVGGCVSELVKDSRLERGVAEEIVEGVVEALPLVVAKARVGGSVSELVEDSGLESRVMEEIVEGVSEELPLVVVKAMVGGGGVLDDGVLNSLMLDDRVIENRMLDGVVLDRFVLNFRLCNNRFLNPMDKHIEDVEIVVVVIAVNRLLLDPLRILSTFLVVLPITPALVFSALIVKARVGEFLAHQVRELALNGPLDNVDDVALSVLGLTCLWVMGSTGISNADDGEFGIVGLHGLLVVLLQHVLCSLEVLCQSLPPEGEFGHVFLPGTGGVDS